jgi:hypothetical protein
MVWCSPLWVKGQQPLFYCPLLSLSKGKMKLWHHLDTMSHQSLVTRCEETDSHPETVPLWELTLTCSVPHSLINGNLRLTSSFHSCPPCRLNIWRKNMFSDTWGSLALSTQGNTCYCLIPQTWEWPEKLSCQQVE